MEDYKYSSLCAVPFYSNFYPESDEIKYLVTCHLFYGYTNWLSQIMSTNGTLTEKRSIKLCTQ
jgi:hypothetical protein